MIWHAHPAGQPTSAPLSGFSGFGNRSGLAITSSQVFNSGLAARVASGMNHPSSPPSLNTYPVGISLPSSFAASSGILIEFDHSSGATSGSPFSFMDVNVGIVSPGTNSTLQLYPCVKIILSISAIA